MIETCKNLIIWDLDGVLADTERMWMYNRMKAVNKLYGFNWDFQTTIEHFDGRNGMDVDTTLKSLGIDDRTSFWNYTKRLDEKNLQKRNKSHLWNQKNAEKSRNAILYCNWRFA